LEHPGDRPWAAVTLFSAQQYKTCLSKKYSWAKTSLLARCEGWQGGDFLKIGWRNHSPSVIGFSRVLFWFGLVWFGLKCHFVLPSPHSLQKVHTSQSTTKTVLWLLSPTACTLQIPRPGLCPMARCISSYEDKTSVAAENFSLMLFTLFTMQY